MKILSTSIVMISLLLLYGCATSYISISKIKSIGDAETSNSDLKVTVGIQPLGDNSRFKDTQEENKISILKLTLENVSARPITVKDKNIYLKGLLDDEPVSQLSPHEVANRMSLATAAYWLWAGLWMGHSENNNGKTSSFWLPIGLPIGAINFFKARSTNNSFEDEITKDAFPDTKLLPGESKSGLIFFNKAGGGKYNLTVIYNDTTSGKKEISIPYKL